MKKPIIDVLMEFAENKKGSSLTPEECLYLRDLATKLSVIPFINEKMLLNWLNKSIK